jgi:hypothetical protein
VLRLTGRFNSLKFVKFEKPLLDLTRRLSLTRLVGLEPFLLLLLRDEAIEVPFDIGNSFSPVTKGLFDFLGGYIIFSKLGSVLDVYCLILFDLFKFSVLLLLNTIEFFCKLGI